MELVKFGNDGVIDPRVWSTFGVSIKTGDDPIGKFGTGLKYAIAVLLREGRSISISSGENTYKFSLESVDFRGKEFHQISCNGELLPFTTHLGHGWELWQVYRELYSNCLDEGGDINYKGETLIEAQLSDIDHSQVFLDKTSRKLLFSTTQADIYSGESSYIYHKGVRVQELSVKSLFTYDLKNCTLTEDRTLKYNFELVGAITSALVGIEDPKLVYKVLLGSRDFFEGSLEFFHTRNTPSEAFISKAAEVRRDSVWKQQSLLDICLSYLGSEGYDIVEMDERQSKIIEKASTFCESIGYPVMYPVHVVSKLGTGVLALADRNTMEIYLSERLLTQGVKQVASTLLEENLHLKEGLSDETYEMQTYLFDQVITLGEKLTGDIL